MIQTQGIKALAILQVLVTFLGAGALAYLMDLRSAASYIVGSSLMLLNTILLSWSWLRLIEKKSIAWTSMIIVIKYAVLLGSLIFCIRSPWFDLLSAGLGFASFLITVLLMAFYLQLKEKI